MPNEHKAMPLAELAGQMSGAAMMGGNAAMLLLLAEMKALGEMLPGVAGQTAGAHSESARRAQDAEVEDSFDNMPV